MIDKSEACDVLASESVSDFVSPYQSHLALVYARRALLNFKPDGYQNLAGINYLENYITLLVRQQVRTDDVEAYYWLEHERPWLKSLPASSAQKLILSRVSGLEETELAHYTIADTEASKFQPSGFGQQAKRDSIRFLFAKIAFDR